MVSVSFDESSGRPPVPSLGPPVPVQNQPHERQHNHSEPAIAQSGAILEMTQGKHRERFEGEEFCFSSSSSSSILACFYAGFERPLLLARQRDLHYCSGP